MISLSLWLSNILTARYLSELVHTAFHSSCIHLYSDSARGFPCLSTLLPTLISCLFDNTHSNRYEVIYHCDLHFPDGAMMLSHLCFTCERMCIQLLCPLLNQIFFGYWILWVLYVLWLLDLSRFITCKYFLPFSRLPLHFVDGFHCCAKLFSMM